MMRPPPHRDGASFATSCSSCTKSAAKRRKFPAARRAANVPPEARDGDALEPPRRQLPIYGPRRRLVAGGADIRRYIITLLSRAPAAALAISPPMGLAFARRRKRQDDYQPAKLNIDTPTFSVPQ